MTVNFVACDGTIFMDGDSCRAYENALPIYGVKCLNNHFRCISCKRINIPDIAYFVCDSLDHFLKFRSILEEEDRTITGLDEKTWSDCWALASDCEELYWFPMNTIIKTLKEEV